MYPQRPSFFDFLPTIDKQFLLDNAWIGWTLLTLAGLVVVWEVWAYVNRRRREKLFDQKLQERIAARAASMQHAVEPVDFFNEGDTEDLEKEMVATKHMLATWESSELSSAERDHMRERSAFHAREWLSREIELGDIHPLHQSHMYNLLYSLRDAETQIAALRETQELQKAVSPRLSDGRAKPRVKLIVPKD